MNNTQLYVSIGVPSFLVVMAWLSNRADIQRMGDRIDKGLDSVRGEMIALRREIHNEMIAFRREIQTDMVSLHERVAIVETRIEKK